MNICVPCKKKFVVKKNGVVFSLDNELTFSADIYECTGCNTEIAIDRSEYQLLTYPNDIKEAHKLTVEKI